MDNSRLWAVETSLDLENWTAEDWNASTTSIEGQRFARPANAYHGGSSTAMLERGVRLLDGDNFTASQIIELENVIESTIQRTLQAYFGTSAHASGRNQGSLTPDEMESATHPFFRTRPQSQRRVSTNFAAIRSSLRSPRGLQRLSSNDTLRKSREMQPESKGSEPAPIVPLSHERNPRSTPDSNAKNISVLVGGFFAYFATFGLLTSFGKFQTYYQLELLKGTKPSTISWIGSVQFFVLFISGLVIGPLFDKYGARRLSIPGTVIFSLALMLTSLGTKFYQILLSQGFLLGIGCALHFYPTTSSVSQRFTKNRGLAMGLVASGSSIGGIIWPIMIDSLLKKVGFGWTLRISGFLALALLSIANILVVERKELRGTTAAAKAQMKAAGTPISFTEPRYLFLAAAFFFIYFGMFIPYYYLPTYGMAHGMSPNMSSYLVAILNGGSFLGRVGCGWAADKVGRFNMTFFCAFCAGLVLACLKAMTTAPTIIVFAVLYGVFSGALLSLPPTCVAQITPHPSMIGVKLGMAMAVASLGLLTGSPIGGALLTKLHGSFSGLIAFSVTVIFIGSMFVLAARFVAEPKLRKAF